MAVTGFAIGTIISVWLTVRITHALETMAMTAALDKMKENLSEVERADIEGRIRENLFM